MKLCINATLIYLIRGNGILRDIFFGSRQLKAKTLGPIIFDRFTLHFLKIAQLLGKIKNAESFKIYKHVFYEQKPSLMAMNSLYNEKGQ